MCVCVPHARPVSSKVRTLNGFELPCEFGGLNPGSLEILLRAEPSLKCQLYNVFIITLL